MGREAKEEQLEMEREAIESYEETGQRSKKVLTQNAMKSTAKLHKRHLDEKQKEKESMSLYEEDRDREMKKAKREKLSKKKKRSTFGSDSLGDSGLFDDKVTHSERKTQADRPAKSNYDFKGYDPDGPKRKNKKRGHNAFKSKSKYKRRK